MEDNESKEAGRPVISMFFGIIITMNADDHVPPHIHARYQGHEASFTFDGNLLKDPQTFDRVRLAFGVPSWPGDIDIAAERVRSDMQVI